MPTRDLVHRAFLAALHRAGWRIVREDYVIRIGNKRLWIDVFAVEETTGRQRLIEIKTFDNPVAIDSLRDAIGQYILYQVAIRYNKVEDTELYLAIPLKAYDELFNTLIGQVVIAEVQLNLVVFDPTEAQILQWLPYQKLPG